MLMRTLLLAGIALVLLTGCGDDGGSGGGTEKSATLTGPVTFERGGGIAGRRDRLVVQPDGKAKLTVQTATKSIQLSDAELADLERELAKADLASLPADCTSTSPCRLLGHRVTSTTARRSPPTTPPCPPSCAGWPPASARSSSATTSRPRPGRASRRAARAPRAARSAVSGGAAAPRAPPARAAGPPGGRP